MDLFQIGLGIAGLMLGARTLRKGAADLANGLGSGGGERVVPDPRARRGAMAGRPIGQPLVTPKGRMELRAVRTLDERINAIRQQITKGKTDPVVIAWARKQVTKRCADRPGGWCIKEKDSYGELNALFEGLRRDVRYTSDPIFADLYATPRRTLQQRAGDCDDASSLACASAMALGHACRLRVVRTKDASSWNHIYALVHDRKSGRWIPFDASVPVRFGWEVPKNMVADQRTFEVAF